MIKTQQNCVQKDYYREKVIEIASLKPKKEIRDYDIPMSLEDHIEKFRKRIIDISLGKLKK